MKSRRSAFFNQGVITGFVSPFQFLAGTIARPSPYNFGSSQQAWEATGKAIRIASNRQGLAIEQKTRKAKQKTKGGKQAV